MKRVLSLLFVAIIALSLMSCDRVPPGFVGVKAYAVGTDKGVDHEVIGPGRYWLWWGTELYTFPTFQQTYVFTKDVAEGDPLDESFSFQTAEGLEVNTDIGITYHLDPTKISTIFQKYRHGVKEITSTQIRGIIRDGFNIYASKVEVESVYGSGKTALIDSVQKYVERYFDPIGISIDRLYLVGSFRLPGNVTSALNAKIEAKQKAAQYENEVAQSIAEANKQIARARGDSTSAVIRAAGEAQANKLKQMTLTPLLVEYDKVHKWNGQLPTYTGGGIPMINLGGK